MTELCRATLVPQRWRKTIVGTLASAFALLWSAALLSAPKDPNEAQPAATATASAPASAATSEAISEPPAPVSGPERLAAPARPETSETRACSIRESVCIHPSRATPAWVSEAVFRAAESALSAYRALSLPAPLSDEGRGGTRAWDIYIGPSDGPSVTLPDPEAFQWPLDQAPVYTLFSEPSTWGCELDFEIARHAAEAMIARLDAGAERGLVDASASYLASIVAPCAAIETPAVDAFQAKPYRAITEPAAGPAHGGMLFPMFLEDQGGSGDPGRLIASLFAIATQTSDPGSRHYQNEPDTFDALRSSMQFRKATINDLLLDFAVARAFTGDRSDGLQISATEVYGKAGRVFFEWSVPFSSLPRRLAPLHPVEPTGATYLWLDLASAPKDTEFTFVADWELPSVFRWSLVKVAKDGSLAGRIDLAGIFGGTHVERSVVLREDLAGILIVGTITASLNRTLPFDPDDGPFMPHSYEVTLYGPIPGSPSPGQ